MHRDLPSHCALNHSNLPKHEKDRVQAEEACRAGRRGTVDLRNWAMRTSAGCESDDEPKGARWMNPSPIAAVDEA